MAHGTHDYEADPRNENILIHLNGTLVPRAEAMVSVFDSGFMLGDGIWEGIRVHNGKMAFLDEHLRRLFEGAKSLDMDIGKSAEEITALLFETIQANGMHDDTHIRLMVTRGMKSTPYQDPAYTITAPTIVAIPEYKQPRPETLTEGLRLFTVHVRRGRPDVQDPKWNSHSKLNCISACIQAGKAGADEALMLDPQGFVATCNSMTRVSGRFSQLLIIAVERLRGPDHMASRTGADEVLPAVTALLRPEDQDRETEAPRRQRPALRPL